MKTCDVEIMKAISTISQASQKESGFLKIKTQEGAVYIKKKNIEMIFVRENYVCFKLISGFQVNVSLQEFEDLKKEIL